MMNRFRELIVGLVLAICVPHLMWAQCATQYTDIGPSGSRIHAWSFMFDNYTNSSSGCASGMSYFGGFRHTYYVTVSLQSPSGRSTSVTGSGSQSSGSGTGYAQGDAYLDLLDEPGPFSTSGQSTIDCSFAGRFWNSSGGDTYYNFPDSFLTDLQGAVLSYGSFDTTTGNFYNVRLTPEAFNYLVSSGFIVPAAGVAVTIWVPGVGEVVFAITVAVVAYSAIKTLPALLKSRGHSDPAIVQTLGNSRPGTRDSQGRCVQTPPPKYKWQQQSKSITGTPGIHWHWIEWNQEPTTCAWFIARLEGPSDPGPGYILIPGIW